MTGVNSGVEHSYLSRTVEYTTVISGIRLVGSSVFCVLFCGSLCFFALFIPFSCCNVCSLIYGLRLPFLVSSNCCLEF